MGIWSLSSLVGSDLLYSSSSHSGLLDRPDGFSHKGFPLKSLCLYDSVFLMFILLAVSSILSKFVWLRLKAYMDSLICW